MIFQIALKSVPAIFHTGFFPLQNLEWVTLHCPGRLLFHLLLFSSLCPYERVALGGQASCPNHTAPPILLRVAPVTEDNTLYSSRQRKTPMKAMIKASLNFTS